MHRSVEDESVSFMAQKPIPRITFRANSTSTSFAYSFSSMSIWSTLSGVTRAISTSSFSILTYKGSLYLQKKTRTSFINSVGNCSNIT